MRILFILCVLGCAFKAMAMDVPGEAGALRPKVKSTQFTIPFDLTPEEWAALSEYEQAALVRLILEQKGIVISGAPRVIEESSSLRNTTLPEGPQAEQPMVTIGDDIDPNNIHQVFPFNPQLCIESIEGDGEGNPQLLGDDGMGGSQDDGDDELNRLPVLANSRLEDALQENQQLRNEQWLLQQTQQHLNKFLRDYLNYTTEIQDQRHLNRNFYDWINLLDYEQAYRLCVAIFATVTNPVHQAFFNNFIVDTEIFEFLFYLKWKQAIYDALDLQTLNLQQEAGVSLLNCLFGDARSFAEDVLRVSPQHSILPEVYVLRALAIFRQCLGTCLQNLYSDDFLNILQVVFSKDEKQGLSDFTPDIMRAHFRAPYFFDDHSGDAAPTYASYERRNWAPDEAGNWHPGGSSNTGGVYPYYGDDGDDPDLQLALALSVQPQQGAGPMDESSSDSRNLHGDSQKNKDTKNEEPIEDDGDNNDDEMGYVPGQGHPFGAGFPCPDPRAFGQNPYVEIIGDDDSQFNDDELSDVINQFFMQEYFQNRVDFLVGLGKVKAYQVLEALKVLLEDLDYKELFNSLNKSFGNSKNTIGHQFGRRGGVDYGINRLD